MKKDTLFNLGRFAGILIIVAGIFCREWLPDDKEYIALVLIMLGIVINTISFFHTKRIYVCSECKKDFDMPEKEIALAVGKYRSVFSAAVLTCPYCKKTNLCMGKRVAGIKER